jgi:hypothetical protein
MARTRGVHQHAQPVGGERLTLAFRQQTELLGDIAEAQQAELDAAQLGYRRLSLLRPSTRSRRR